MGIFKEYIDRRMSLEEGRGNPILAFTGLANKGLAATLGVGGGAVGLAGTLLAAVAGGVLGGIEGLGGIPDAHDKRIRHWSGKERGLGALVGMATNAVRRAWQFAKPTLSWGPNMAVAGWDAGGNILPEATADPAMDLANALRPLLGGGDKALEPGAKKIAEVLKAVPPAERERVILAAARSLGLTNRS